MLEGCTLVKKIFMEGRNSEAFTVVKSHKT